MIIRFHERVHSVRVRGLPLGSRLERLIRPARAADGTLYAVGTTFVPIAGGYDNGASAPYSDLSIVEVQS